MLYTQPYIQTDGKQQADESISRGHEGFVNERTGISSEMGEIFQVEV